MHRVGKEVYAMRSKAGVAAIIVAIFAIGAATVPSASAASASDACLLLTQAQLGTVFGIPFGAGSHVSPQYPQTCTWAPTGESTKGVRTVTLRLNSADAYETGKAAMELSEAKMKGEGKDAGHMPVTPVSGIGQDAYYLSLGNVMSLISKKGNVSCNLTLYGGDFPVEKKKAMEKALVLQILSRL
jgi:hypothetical protein